MQTDVTDWNSKISVGLINENEYNKAR